MGKSPSGQLDKPIVFTDHARDRMAERVLSPDEWPLVTILSGGITEDEVIGIIRNGRSFHRGEVLRFVKGRFSVVTIETADCIKVLTVTDSV